MVHFTKKSIITRLSFYVGCVSMLTISIIIAFFVVILRDATVQRGKDYLASILDAQILHTSITVNKHIHAVQIFSSTVQATRNAGPAAQAELERTAEDKMKALPTLIAMGFVPLPDDAEDRAVRFAHEGVHILSSFTPISEEERHTLHTMTTAATLSRPFTTLHEDKEILAATYTLPVLQENTPLGFVYGVISLAEIQELLSNTRPFGGGYLAFYSNDSTYIYYPDTKRIGTRMAERPGNEARASALLEGKEFIRDSFQGTFLGDASYSVLKPIHFTTVDSPWGMQATITLQFILANMKIQSLQAVGMGIVGMLLLVGGFLFFIRKLILKPLQQIESSAAALSQGIFTKRLDIDSYDEIGNTAQSLNRALDTITHKMFWYEALLHAIPNAVVASNMERKVTFANNAAIDHFITPENDQTPENACSFWDVCGQTPNISEAATLCTTLDNKTYSVQAKLLQNKEQQHIGYIEVATDVTELMALKNQAEEANRSKSDFLARMSHEIRTPMNAIMGMSALAMESPTPEAQKNYLKKAIAATKSLLVIINDILDFSKIEAGKFIIESNHFSLNNTLRLLQEIILIRCQEKEISFTLTLQPNMPDIFYGPKERLLQVLINLCGNAVKFTNHGGSVTVTVQANSMEDGQIRLQCQVSDTGVGIVPEKLTTIFAPFEQAEGSSTRKVDGTGLGLAISKDLVHMMHGEIWVESTPKQGSTFSFYSILQPGDAAQIQEDGEGAHPNASLQGLAVLLAEDNEINQEIACELLTRQGATVVVANNGKEAVEKFGQGQFDVILMDIAMPEMDGLEATQTIRQSSLPGAQTVPIIAMTAHALIGDKEKSLNAGMNDHITKPLDIQEFIAKILEWTCMPQ